LISKYNNELETIPGKQKQKTHPETKIKTEKPCCK
jgi:hypothetical protein